MVSETGSRPCTQQPTTEGDRHRTRPETDNIKNLLGPFRARYSEVLNERARLAYKAARTSPTASYASFRLQSRLDDLTVKLELLESEIAQVLYSNMDDLIQDGLAQAVSDHLARSRTKMVGLRGNPADGSDVRSILYRMHRGGTFYPLVFPREIGMEIFRTMARRIDEEGMRGNEIAARTRKLVLRTRFRLREAVCQGLDSVSDLEQLGEIRWSWRRGKIVRRRAYAPKGMLEQARAVVAMTDSAIRGGRHAPKGRQPEQT